MKSETNVTPLRLGSEETKHNTTKANSIAKNGKNVQELHPHTHTHTTVLRLFFRDHPGEPVPEENLWTLWCKGRLKTTPKYKENLNQQSTLSTAQMHVCISLCTTVIQNIAQNSSDSDNLPSCPPDIHHSSDDVCWREREGQCGSSSNVILHYLVKGVSTFSGASKADVIDGRQHGAHCSQLIAANTQHVHCVADL